MQKVFFEINFASLNWINFWPAVIIRNGKKLISISVIRIGNHNNIHRGIETSSFRELRSSSRGPRVFEMKPRSDALTLAAPSRLSLTSRMTSCLTNILTLHVASEAKDEISIDGNNIAEANIKKESKVIDLATDDFSRLMDMILFLTTEKLFRSGHDNFL